MKKKFGLFIGGITLLIIVVAAWYLYPAMMGQLDQEEMALLEEILEEEGVGDVDTTGNESEPFSKETGDTGKNDTSTGTEPDSTVPDDLETSGTINPSETPQELSPQEKEAQIDAKYEAQCKSLQSEFEGKLNGLINAALKEYQSMGSDVGNLDKLKLAKKYVGLGNALEDQCDVRFEAIMGNLSKELKAEGFSLGAVDQAKELYSAQKSARKKKLLDKALDN